MRLLEQEDGALGEIGQPASLAGDFGLFQQAGRSLVGEPLFPGIERMLGDAHQGCEILGGQATALPAVEDHESLLGVVRRRLHLLGPTQPTSAARAASPRGQSEPLPAEVRDWIEMGGRVFGGVAREPGGLVCAEIILSGRRQDICRVESGFIPEIGRASRLVCVLDRLDRFRIGGVHIFRFCAGRALRCALVALRFDRVRFVLCLPIVLGTRCRGDRFFRGPFARRASSTPPPAPLVPHLLLASAASPRLGGDVDCSGQFSKLCGKNSGWGDTQAILLADGQGLSGGREKKLATRPIAELVDENTKTPRSVPKAGSRLSRWDSFDEEGSQGFILTMSGVRGFQKLAGES